MDELGVHEGDLLRVDRGVDQTRLHVAENRIAKHDPVVIPEALALRGLVDLASESTSTVTVLGMRGQIRALLNMRHDEWECRVVYTPHAYRAPGRVGIERITDFGPKDKKKMTANFGALPR